MKQLVSSFYKWYKNIIDLFKIFKSFSFLLFQNYLTNTSVLLGLVEVDDTSKG